MDHAEAGTARGADREAGVAGVPSIAGGGVGSGVQQVAWGCPCASRAGRRWRGGRSGCLREMEARDATGHGERLRLLARPGDVLRDLAPTLANRRKSRARPSDL